MRGMKMLAALVLGAATQLQAHEAGECTAFTWDISRELAAMRAPARPATASLQPKIDLVRIDEGVHYSTALQPQGAVTFVAPPGKKARAEKPTAGLLFFRTPRAGLYRISLNSRHWIDVVDGARSIESRDHQGRSQCKLLHKVVEFEIPAERLLTIQLSGDDAATVDFVITAVGKS